MISPFCVYFILRTINMTHQNETLSQSDAD